MLEMIARWDEQGRPVVMSVVAVAAAARDSGAKDATDLLLCPVLTLEGGHRDLGPA
ncbi:hypothetical protein SMD20_46580 [Nonomuraea sp. LP-02]|uniref:hypothetical protein n=1 Tax=Nonomuraea sp. LP-02 TaxID=3097960 RepID=UPI002E35FDB3|nr:hypothetical protein [Nonomuraea sp. LP-02]MED7931756.1 hypothetical protein [Nonomuraea sp. LP-02]